MKKILLTILIFTVVLGYMDAQTSKKINIKTFLSAINKERSKACKCGRKKTPKVGNVIWNSKLAKAATNHARYLLKKKKLSHYGYKRSIPGDRISAIGYKWGSCAENVAYGETLTMFSVLREWMKSPDHCNNIKGSSYTEIGMAELGSYWVLVFASPLKIK